ncbi:MAG: amidohydrolase family protein [Ignavibacterium sp.]|jgi:imidazolonepropionase-like amidohydrolase
MKIFLAFLVFVCPAFSPAQIAVKGETVHTMAGAPIRNGVVLIKGTTIERVGPASEVAVPAGYRIMTARVVTPGLVDAHTTVGLSGIYNVPHDQMQLEKSDPIQPHLRAMDAYNPREDLVAWVRTLGVTTINTGHGPGALMSGTTMIAKTAGETVHEALVRPDAMVAFTLGSSVSRNFKSPGTRAKGMAMLRQEFLKAQEYMKKMQARDPDKRPARDLALDMVAGILRGEITALITAQTAPEIMSALRLQKEFGFRMVLDGAAEAYLVPGEIKAAGVPVILHPTMVRTGDETKNASFTTAAKLRDAGIRFAIQSGYEGYVPKVRVVLFEAAVAAANGLSFEDALRSVTIDAARILGVEARVGSLERGKDADVVLFDGDPFEYTTRTCAVIINGAIVSETCR